MNFLHFPFVRLLFALIAGLLAHSYFPSRVFVELWAYSISIGGLGLLIYAFLHPVGLRRSQKHWGAAVLLLMGGVGYALGYAQYQYRHPKEHWLRKTAIHGPLAAYTACIQELGQTSTAKPKAVARLIAVQQQGHWLPSNGKVLLYLPPSLASLRYGDTLLIKGTPQPIAPPANPKAFDYKAYLASQGIYGQHFVKNWTGKLLSEGNGNSLQAMAWEYRTRGLKHLEGLLQDPAVYGIAQALILGDKTHIEGEVRRAYSSAGAMHVLAVSGLHVGIVVGLLAWMLRRWQRREGYKWWVLLSQLVLLWGYALLTGGSPSVLRASTMFSILLIGQVLQRNNHAGQSMAIAAFLLLCYDSSLLFQVGFQLSYAAVMGIVFLQPPIYSALVRRFPVRHGIIDYILQMAAVSLAAQAATLPITLYYFHQFPTYFLLANYWVVPLAGIILPLGIATLLCASIPYVNEGLGWLLYQGVTFMNYGIRLLEDLPYPHVPNIPFDGALLILSYALLGGYSLFWKEQTWKHAGIICACCSCIFLYRLEQCRQLGNIASLTVYSHRKLAIGVIDGGSALLLHDSLNDEAQQWVVDKHWLSLGLGKGQRMSLPEAEPHIPMQQMGRHWALAWRGRVLLVVNTDALPHSLPIADIYLINSPDLLPMPQAAVPATVLLSSSLSWNGRTRWARELFPQQKIHSLREKAWHLLN